VEDIIIVLSVDKETMTPSELDRTTDIFKHGFDNIKNEK